MRHDEMLMYNPARLLALVGKTREAIDDLYDTTSGDPVAAEAMRTIREIAFALDTTWLPVLSRLGADTSMTAWRGTAGVISVDVADGSAGGPGVSGFRSSPAANSNVDPEQVETMRQLVDAFLDGDEAAVAGLNELLEDADPEVVAALLAAMGPETYVLMMVGLVHTPGSTDYPDMTNPQPVIDADARDELAVTLATGIDTFDPAHLADAMVAILVDPPADTRPGEAEFAVSYVVVNASSETQATFVDAAGSYERETGNQFGYASSGTGLLGSAVANPSGSPVRLDSDAGTEDPLAVALTELASDPAEARQLLADPDLHTYLLLEREWNDGYTAIMTASAAAAAGPDLQDSASLPSAATVLTANEIASRTVNQLGAGGVTYRDVSPEASEAAGRILGLHAAAVDSTVTATVVAGGGPVVLSSEHVLSGEVATYRDPALGDVDVAVFGTYELGNFVAIASSTDEGLVAMTTGVGIFQQARIDAGIDLVRSGEWTDRQFEILQHQAANLEGFVYQQIGWQAQQAGRDQNASQGFFIQTMAVLGRGVAYAFTVPTGQSWAMGFYGYGEEVADSVFASEYEATAVAAATSDASDASALLNYRFLQSLDAAGLLDVQLAPLDEFLDMTGADQIDYGGQVVTGGTGSSVDGFVFNPLDTHTQFVVVQLDPFNETPPGWDPPPSGPPPNDG